MVETKYLQVAEEVIELASQNAENVVASMHTMAILYSTMVAAASNLSLPFLTLNDFGSFAADMEETSQASAIAYVPLLNSDTEAAEWNAYATQQSHSISEGESTDKQITPYIWKYDMFGNIQPESGLSLYAPLWQLHPKPRDFDVNFHFINFNLASKPQISELIARTLETRKPVLSAPSQTGNTFGFESAFEPKLDEGTPKSLLFYPIFSSREERAPIAACIVASIPSTAILENLPIEDQGGVTVVFESCGKNSTFGLKGAHELSYLGSGDLHDSKFNQFGVKSDILPSTWGCDTAIYVFPTDALLHEGESSNGALIISVSVLSAALAVVTLIAAVLFCRKRNTSQSDENNNQKSDEESTLGDRESAQSIIPPGDSEKGSTKADPFMDGEVNKVVASEPLKLKEPAPSASCEKKVEAPPSPKKITMGNAATTKEALMSFVNDTQTGTQSNTKPIAELFPEATVLFADIAGFTAWSSIREPSQVFTLLESIFQAFDVIAQRCGVFKVETVGDCYVAVVGVTEYKKDHALIMAHFARASMDRFATVVHDLELQLGPDTGELAMRFGIHSGPVTAGVLRGDRARFQLFGDTVNTAARIETNGMRGKIHLSEQTAAQIQSFGHHDWVVPRNDEIQAKGKGFLKTFWLRLNGELTKFRAEQLAKEREEDNKAASANVSGDEEVVLKKPSFMEQVLARKAAKEQATNSKAAKDKKQQRLVEWNAELLLQLLKQIVQKRRVSQEVDMPACEIEPLWSSMGAGKMVVEEVAQIIHMPPFDKDSCSKKAKNVDIGKETVAELRNFVALLASMYLDNPFHNFEHASHVTMSVSKLLSRIIAPQNLKLGDNQEEKDEALHDHTYGITSDPLTQFGVVLSALIHDVDHRGVPNFLLISENESLASKYQKRSVAEQNSVDIAWAALLAPEFQNLRSCIVGNQSDLERFRQLIVNSVIATDIFDKDLGAARKERWNKAFSEEHKDDEHAMDRKATIVIEHLIQASDVAHTMQHWHVYQKWNLNLYQEMYAAHISGRWATDPTPNWYKGEIGFFDNYVIPLAKKLQTCGVFGISSDEYLNYATQNRKEWASRGEEEINRMLQSIRKSVEEAHGKKD